MGRGWPPLGLPQRKHVWKPESEGIVSPDFAGRLRRPAKWVGLVLVSKHRSTGASPVVTKSKSLGAYQKRGAVNQERAAKSFHENDLRQRLHEIKELKSCIRTT